MISIFDMFLMIAAGAGISILVSIAWNYIALKNAIEKFEKTPESILKSVAFEQIFKRMNANLEFELQKLRLQIDSKNKTIEQFQENLKNSIIELEKKLEDISIFEHKIPTNLLDLESIKGNTIFLEYLENALEIKLLKSTLVHWQPQIFEGKQLDEIQLYTLSNFWQLYQLKDEFLPAFKREILAEIEQMLLRHKSKSY